MASGKRSKKIRKKVYGNGKLARKREHTKVPKSGKLVADPQRRIYKKMKKAMKGVPIG